jgi:methyltransferase (TIGR00027 family)
VERASRTAEAVAIRRAAHQVVDVPPLFVDPVAIRLLGRETAARLRERPREFDRSRVGRYLRAFLVARSRFAEDCAGEAVARGVGQYVLLGAGFDTFAYRNPYPQLRVFEVDHPATQNAKRQRLAAAHVAVPSNVSYVAIDFASEALHIGGGFDPAQPAVFAWLGVVPYLERPAIEAVLRYVASLKAGSELVFDYGIPPQSLGWLARLVYRYMAGRVAAAGEPWKSYFTPREMRTLLKDFAKVEDLGPDQINQRYFAGRKDGLQVRGAGRLVRAVVG